MTSQASVACVRVQAVQASYQRPPLSPSPIQSHNALLHLNVSDQDYCELDRNILQLCGMHTHTQKADNIHEGILNNPPSSLNHIHLTFPTPHIYKHKTLRQT